MPHKVNVQPTEKSPPGLTVALGESDSEAPGTVMQKGSGKKRVCVFQEPNQHQQHFDFKASTPFMNTCQAQSVQWLVCPRLNNPYKYMCFICFPYVGQVGFPTFLYSRPLLISCRFWTYKTTFTTTAKVSFDWHNVGGKGNSPMWFPFTQQIVTEHWAWHRTHSREQDRWGPWPDGATAQGWRLGYLMLTPNSVVPICQHERCYRIIDSVLCAILSSKTGSCFRYCGQGRWMGAGGSCRWWGERTGQVAVALAASRDLLGQLQTSYKILLRSPLGSMPMIGN